MTDLYACTRCGTPKPDSDFSRTGGRYRNGKCKPCMVDLSREWRANNPSRYAEHKRNNVLRKYGLTTESYDALVKSQDGCCAICLQPLTGRVVVDHDHACCPGVESCGGCVRGAVHHKCNVILGMADDSVTLLRNAADYLERTKS